MCHVVVDRKTTTKKKKPKKTESVSQTPQYVEQCCMTSFAILKNQVVKVSPGGSLPTTLGRIVHKGCEGAEGMKGAEVAKDVKVKGCKGHKGTQN